MRLINCIVGLALALSACGRPQPSALSCGNPEAKERVLVRILQNVANTDPSTADLDVRHVILGGDTLPYSFDGTKIVIREGPDAGNAIMLHNVYTIRRDETADSWACGAEAEFEEQGASLFTLPVSYTSVITEEGRPFITGTIGKFSF
jgi:hypothetical protein